MRHLKNRENFLFTEKYTYSPNGATDPLFEYSFENDITWGGSLLGRLINSTLRKAKVGFNYTKIGSIVKQVKSELEKLGGQVFISEEDSNKATHIIVRALLEELYKVSTGSDDIKVKLEKLLGNSSTEGMIDNVISEVEKLEIENKEELLEKLRKFKADLLELQKELGLEIGEGDEEEDEEDEKSKKKDNPTRIFYENSKYLLQAVCKIHLDIKNNTVKFERGTNDDIKVGEEYLYTNSKGETKKVKVISLTNVIDDGPDDSFLTRDDIKKKEIQKGFVSVAFMQKDGTYDKSAGGNTIAVDPKSLKKSEHKTDTFFDDKKYQQQRDKTEQEINTKISMAKKGLSVYTAKKNKERINFYNSEIAKYQKRLNQNIPGTAGGKSGGSSQTVHNKPDPVHSGGGGADIPVRTIESIINEEIDANLRDQESDAKIAWNKVINAYNKSGIVKFIPHIESILNPGGMDKVKESKKKIMEIGRQVIINYDNIGKPIPFTVPDPSTPDEKRGVGLIKEQSGPSISDISKSISLFGRVLLAYSEDMGLLGSYGASYKSDGKNAGGAGAHIKLFIKSFNEIKEVYPLLKKESLLITKYASFMLIKEAEEGEAQNISQPIELDPTDTSDKNLDDTPADKPAAADAPADAPADTPTDTSAQNIDQNPDDGDRVKKSWFKFFKKGEEKKWVITNEDAKLRDNIEKSTESTKKLEDAANNDHIIKIVNLFGRAYRLYAVDYIPSGRPGGRVSQKTLREYEHIGKGDPRDGSSKEGIIPGFGPWAAKGPYNKWQDGITNILEDKKYRTILANINFVSEAESSTDTSMGKPGSGKTLMSFINDLLDNQEGTFKTHRKVIFQKYFGVGSSTSKGENVPSNAPGIPNDINPDEAGETDMPSFSDQVAAKLLTELNKTVLKVTSSDNVYTILPSKVDKDRKEFVIFKYQVSIKNNPKQSIINDCIEGQETGDGKKLKMNNVVSSISYSPGMETKIGFALTSKNAFLVNNVFKFKTISLKDVLNSDFSKITDSSIKLTKIEYLVVPTIIKRKGESKQVLEMVKVKKFSNKYTYSEPISDKLIEEFKK